MNCSVYFIIFININTFLPFSQVLGYYIRNGIDTSKLIAEIMSIASSPTKKYFFDVSEEAALIEIVGTLGDRIFNIEGPYLCLLYSALIMNKRITQYIKVHLMEIWGFFTQVLERLLGVSQWKCPKWVSVHIRPKIRYWLGFSLWDNPSMSCFHMFGVLVVYILSLCCRTWSYWVQLEHMNGSAPLFTTLLRNQTFYPDFLSKRCWRTKNMVHYLVRQHHFQMHLYCILTP